RQRSRRAAAVGAARLPQYERRAGALSRHRSADQCGRPRNRLSKYEEHPGGAIQALLRTALTGINWKGDVVNDSMRKILRVLSLAGLLLMGLLAIQFTHICLG